jgi:hypothetical protein
MGFISKCLESKQITAHCKFAHYWKEILHAEWQVAALQLFAKLMTLAKNSLKKAFLMRQIAELISHSFLNGFR